MVYIDENGKALESIDLNLGRLEDAEWADYPEVKEVGHYEYEQLEGGGRMLRYVIDVAYQAARRELVKQRFIPFTAEELAQMEAIKNRPTQEERISILEEENRFLKEALDLLLSGVTTEEVTDDA